MDTAAHPVNMTHEGDLRRSRLTTFFRNWLVMPHSIWLALWGIPVSFVYLYFWLATLFMGRSPADAWNYLARYFVYMMRIHAYQMYLSDAFPPFNGTDPYAATATIEPPEGFRQSRLSFFFRGILAIPSLIVMLCYAFGLAFVVIYAWLMILITGQIPAGAQSFGERAMIYMARANAYYLCLTDVKPVKSA